MTRAATRTLAAMQKVFLVEDSASIRERLVRRERLAYREYLMDLADLEDQSDLQVLLLYNQWQ